MGFARVEQWDVQRTPTYAWAPDGRRKRETLDRKTYRLAALIGCLLVHGGLLYLFALRLGEREAVRVPGASASAMTLIDIGKDDSLKQAPEQPPSAATPPPPAQGVAVIEKSELEASVPAMPPEWSVVQLKQQSVAVAVASPQPAAASAGSSAGGGGGSAGRGGNGYDPYAGAAPLPFGRFESASLPRPAVPTPPLALPPGVDRVTFKAVLRKVCRHLPSSLGSVTFRFVVAPYGIVKEARMFAAAPDKDDVDRMARMFVGRRLFDGVTTRGERRIKIGPVPLTACR